MTDFPKLFHCRVPPGRWKGGRIKTPHCGTYVIQGLLPFGRDPSVPCMGLLRFNLYEAVEKSVCYCIRA